MTSLPSRKRLAYLYRRGATHRQLAARYSVNESTIRRMLRGLVDSRRSGPPKRPATDDDIIRLRDAGVPWRQLAAEVDMSSAGVRKRYAVATTGKPPWTIG